jgi:hexosaminidase
MRRFIILFLVTVVSVKAFAITGDEPKVDPQNLHISWEVVDNNYQNKARGTYRNCDH